MATYRFALIKREKGLAEPIDYYTTENRAIKAQEARYRREMGNAEYDVIGIETRTVIA